jgi:hypothetical protein
MMEACTTVCAFKASYRAWHSPSLHLLGLHRANHFLLLSHHEHTASIPAQLTYCACHHPQQLAPQHQ